MTRRRLTFLVQSVTGILALVSSSSSFASGAGLTYHGRLLTASNQPVAAMVQFQIQVLSPAPSNCVLWEETQSQDLTTTSGVFVLAINGPSSTQTGGLSNFEQIFSNTQSLSSLSCAVGTSYTPLTNDARVLRVSFNDGTFVGWELAPDQAINYSPKAIDALQVAGFPATSLLRFTDSGGNPVGVSPLSNAQYTELTNLIAGTSTQYAKSSSSGVDVPVVSSAPTSPVNGQMWYDTGSGKLEFYNGSVQAIDTAGGSVTSVTAGSGLVSSPAGGITATGSLSLAAVGSGGSGTKLSFDTYGRVTGSAALTETDLPSIVTAGKVSGSAITSGTLAGAVSVNTSGAITTTGTITSTNSSATSATTNNFILYKADNSNKVTLTASNSQTSNYGLVLPTTAGSSGQVLSTDGSGNLSWMSASTGSVTSVAAAGTSGNPILISGSAQAPTIDITKATASQNGYLAASDFTTFNNKLGSSLSNGSIWIGNSSNAPAAVTISGDVSTTTAGAFTVSGLQGQGVAATTPLADQVLQYDSGTSKWTPKNFNIGSLRTTTGAAQFTQAACTAAQTLTWSSLTDAFSCTNIEISASSVSGLGTAAALNAGTGANNIVELDGSSKLPVVDGSALTNLNAAAVNSGTLALAQLPIVPLTKGGTGLSTAGAANQLLGMNAAASGYEYKTLTQGSGVTITHTAGTVTIAASGSGGTITALTGDVAASGSGSVTAMIQPNAVTSAKINDGAITTAKLFINPGVGRLVVTDSTDGSTLAAQACTTGQLLTWDATAGWVCTAQSSLSGGSSASAINFTGSLSGDVTGTQGATSVAQVGGVTAANVASGANLANAATSANTASTLIKRDGSGNFVAGTAALTSASLSSIVYNDAGSNSVTLQAPSSVSTSYTLKLPMAIATTSGQILASDTSGNLSWFTLPASSAPSGAASGDLSGNYPAPSVATVGTSTAANIHTAEVLANAATASNTASTIVKRDASGNFAASAVTETSSIYKDAGSNTVTVLAPSTVSTSYAMKWPAAVAASNGLVLSSDTSGNLSWANPSTGSVTSVGLSLPSIFNVTTATVTSSGTLTAALTSETQNQVFAAPLAGNGTPSFRNLNIADLKSSVSGSFLTGSGCTSGQALQYSAVSDSISCQALSAAATNLSGIVPIANGGTNSSTALNNNRVMVSSGGAIVEAGALTNGQLLIGSTGAAPQAATLTQGSGVTITNTAGAITIAATGSGGTVTSVTAGTGLVSSPAGGVTTTGSLSLASVANNTLLANTSGSSAAPVATSISSVLDSIGSTQGSVLYRGSAGWSVLTPGTSGTFLQTQGPSANPVWATPAGTGITALTGDVTASGSGSVAATVAQVGGVTAANVAAGANLANAATNVNTASTIIKRDASGNFVAGLASLTSASVSNVIYKDSGSNSVTLQAPSTVSTSYTLKLPPAVAATTGQVLTSDTSGNLSWLTAATGSVTSVTAGSGLVSSPVGGVTTTGSLSLASIANNTLLANTSGASAAPVATSVSTILDSIGSTQGSVLYRGSSGWSVLTPGTSGSFLQSQGASANPVWASGNAGTVTSVGLLLPSIFVNPASPITTSGTLTATLATEVAHQALLGPTSGANATPSFRNFNISDLLSTVSGAFLTGSSCTTGQALQWSSTTDTMSCQTLTIAAATNISGTLPIANGGTGTTTGSITGTGELDLSSGGTNQNVVLTPSGNGYTLLNGKVGIGTTAPMAKLTVAGPIVSVPGVVAAAAIDLSTSDTFTLASVGGSAITLSNMVHGGMYTLVVTDATSRQYTFSGCNTTKFKPANTTTVASTTTIYTVLTTYNGANYDCYVTWATGYQ